MAFADSLMGTNTAASYQAPTSKKQVEQQKLMQLMDKEQQSVADDQINYLRLQEMIGNNADKMDAKKQFLEVYKQKVGNDSNLGWRKVNDSAAKGEKLPGDAYKAAQFLKEGEMAENTLGELTAQGYYGPSRMDQLRGLVNEAKDPNAQLFDVAVNQFANANYALKPALRLAT